MKWKENFSQANGNFPDSRPRASVHLVRNPLLVWFFPFPPTPHVHLIFPSLWPSQSCYAQWFIVSVMATWALLLIDWKTSSLSLHRNTPSPLLWYDCSAFLECCVFCSQSGYQLVIHWNIFIYFRMYLSVLYIYIYIYIYIHTYTYMHTYTHTHICENTYA